MKYPNIDGPTLEDERHDRGEYERAHNLPRADRQREIFDGRSRSVVGEGLVVLAGLAAITLASWVLLSGVRWLWEHPLWR